MTLTLDLPPDLQRRLEARAAAEGAAVEDVARRALDSGLAPSPLDGQGDPYAKPPERRSEELQRAFAQWDEEDADVTPEQAEREWEEFKKGMNDNRRATGERLVYPE